MIFTIRSACYQHESYKPCKKAFFNKEKNIWCVELNTLEELVELKDELAERYSTTNITFDGLIIGYDGDSSGILIYDTYLE